MTRIATIPRKPARLPVHTSPVSAPDLAAMAFETYIAAAKRAQETKRLADGIEAGRRWGDFVRLFASAA